MSVVIPPGAIVPEGKPAPDVGKPKGRFASLYESRAPKTPFALGESGSPLGGIEPLNLEGSGEEGGLSPADLRSAYRIPSTGGSGQTIAIVDAYDDPNAEADLKTYRARYGLPECTAANGCFRKINQEGKTSNYPAANASWAVEISLDLDMASAICPACHILLVEANTATNEEDLGKAVETAANYTAPGWGKATVISNSWGREEWFPYREAEDEEEQKTIEGLEKEEEETELAFDKYLNHPGTPVLFSAGDFGYEVLYPAVSPNVIAVGGTTLFKTPHTERGWFEEAWLGSGGGCGHYEKKPAWQTDTGCAKRMNNDVAAVASNASPVSVYDSYGTPGWIDVFGTSASAPIVAGVEALSSATFREEGAQAFWKNQKSFSDVTTGFNAYGECLPRYFCNAGPGYDGPTGNGTPKLEAGGEGRPRKWTSMPMPAAEGESYDVSCTSISFCMELGAEENAQNFPGYPAGFPSIRTWNGSEWSPTAEPATVKGGSQYRLFGVSCLASTDCIAVGRYYDESGARRTLAERWNGSAWSVMSTPNPSGAENATLNDVSCSSATSCVAIGYYNGSTPFAEDWNGSEWGVDSIPLPGSAISGGPLDISCASASFCVASGYFRTEGGFEGASLIETWDGSKWSYQVIEPAKKQENVGFERSELSAVSCASTNYCVAMGEYYYQWTPKGGGYMIGEETLIEVWDGSKWTQKAGVSGVVPYFTSISCVSSSYCEAVGFGYTGSFFASTKAALAERWNGSSWSIEHLPTEVGKESILAGVSCTGSASCMATGRYRVPGHTTYETGWTSLALRINGTSLTAGPIAPQTESKSVACASTSSCVAVGGGAGSTHYANAAFWNGGNWTNMYAGLAQPIEAVSSNLAGVSCPALFECVAAGSYTDSSGVRKTLAEGAYDAGNAHYMVWEPQSSPNPSGAKASSLAGVSCPATATCTAVGAYTDEGGVQRTLAESWNGTSWSIQTSPNPAGAKAASLSSVSCASATACTAVGTYTDEGGVQRTLAESWNGTSWSIQTSPNPAGAKAASLSSVSCASATACTAVGAYTDEGGVQRTLAESWNGTSWSIQTSPNPSGAKGSSLKGVFCSGPGSCSAVGTYTDSGGIGRTLAENWNGTSWSIQSSPNPEGSKAATLNAVACSGELCLGVGSATSNGSLTTNISQARWGIGPTEVATEAATFASKGEPVLHGTLNPDGLATSYRFEYGPSTAYGSSIPVSPKEVGSGKTPVAVSQTIAEALKSNSVYHFRLAASNEFGTTYGADKTFSTSPNLHWFACTEQSGGHYLNNKCSTELTSGKWELLKLKEAEKTTITAKGNPIAISSTIGGEAGTLNCETEVTGASLENPSGGGNGTGAAELKFKGCKAEGVWSGCKVTPPAVAVKVELATIEGKTFALVAAKEGTTLATFTFAECAYTSAKLVGTLRGLYSNAESKIEFTTESSAEGLRLGSPAGPKVTTVGSINVETTKGAYVKALGQPVVKTEAATSVKASEATLNGTVNPEGASTRYQFEYGKTTSYGQSVPAEAKDAGEGLTDVKVAELLKGLVPGTLYHYRLTATNGVSTTNGLDKTFTTTAAPLHWFACKEQSGGHYLTSKCSTELASGKWELLKLKEAEKTTITAKGNPIAYSFSSGGISGTLSCETEVTNASLENPTGGANGLGSATFKLKGCKAEGGFSGCKVTLGEAIAEKLEAATIEGKAYVSIMPKEGTTVASFTFAECAVAATYKLYGALRGFYSNAESKIEYNAESSGEALRIGSIAGPKVTPVGSIGLEASGGGYVQALGQPVVKTEAASSIQPTEATLNGTVNPEGAATRYQFEYGKTTSYGQSIPAEAKDAGEGLADVKVAETLKGLVAGTLYHYRLTATSGINTVKGLDKTFTTTAPPLHWFTESGQLKEGEKTTITAKGAPIAYSFSSGGVSQTLSCETEVTGTSLENPSGGANGVGSATFKLKGCKGEGGFAGCKVTLGEAVAEKLEATTIEGKTQVAITPKEGTTVASFTFAECAAAATYKLVGALQGLYSNSESKIEYNAEASGDALRIGSIAGPKVTPVGSIGLETTSGGYLRAE